MDEDDGSRTPGRSAADDDPKVGPGLDGSGDRNGPNGERGDVADDDAPDGSDGEWRFSLDEVGDDGVLVDRRPIEPGTPTLENTLFVLLGVALTVFAIWRLVVLFTA